MSQRQEFASARYVSFMLLFLEGFQYAAQVGSVCFRVCGSELLECDIVQSLKQSVLEKYLAMVACPENPVRVGHGILFGMQHFG